MLELIEYYFNQNCTRQEILDLLSKRHGIDISLSTLKRRLTDLDLKRKNIKESPLQDICYGVICELDASGNNLGYRTLHAKLKDCYDLRLTRDTAYNILKIADPEGMEQRKARRLKRRMYNNPGPDWLWHLDGNDKLGPYGFKIHGCIDGFSRYMLWLEVGTTNKNPYVTAGFFLATVKKLERVPTIIYADYGTENPVIESLQIGLRAGHNDRLAGAKSFMTGKSVHNVKIESFWAQMRKLVLDFYIQLFGAMKERNIFDGSDLHTKCLQFCFGPLIRCDLIEARDLWNKHHIRKQPNRNTPNGKPYALYNLPENYGATDHRKNVDLAAVDRLIDEFSQPSFLFDSQFAEIANTLIPNLQTPTNVEDALKLYENLLRLIEQII